MTVKLVNQNGQPELPQTAGAGPLPPLGTFAFQAYLTANSSVQIGADQVYHEVDGNNSAVGAVSPDFSFSALNFIATYNGTGPKQYLVRVYCTTEVPFTFNFAQVVGCVAINGDTIGTNSQRSNGECGVHQVDDLTPPGGSSSQQGTFERVCDLLPGDTVQPTFCKTLGFNSNDMTLQWCVMTITEVIKTV